ncbi:hypothetical protein, partial [Thiolapillus sp.]
AYADLKVFACEPEWASLAEELGGDKLHVSTVTTALQDPHQVCLRPRDRFWDIPVPKIDSAFDNLLVPQPSWSPSTTQQLRKLVAAPYLSPNDWTPRLDAYFASPLALCARRVSSAASRLLGSTSLRFALHGWQRMCKRVPV